MKTVTGRVISAEPISLSKAAKILSRFVSSKNEASQDVSAYLRRSSAAFAELKGVHREVNSSSSKKTKPRPDGSNERNRAEELEELGRAKGMDDLVGKGGKIRPRKIETVSEEVSICGREQDEIKEDKKKKKKKSKKSREEDVAGEKVNEKMEDEQRNEERKEKKKKMSKTNKEEDIDEKVNEKLEEEQRKGERKKEKKRKSDGEIGSEEKKSKKKRKSKEIDG